MSIPAPADASVPPATFPVALAEGAERVEARLFALLDREVARWEAVDPRLTAPLQTLREFVAAGGKRLRPACCQCAYIGAGGDPTDAVLADAGAALELIHTFALVHDDVMDGSASRRGIATVHRAFEALHGVDEMVGEARRFGEGMAILIGDFALVYADLFARDLNVDARALLDELRVELCVGQTLDMLGTAVRARDVVTAQRIATYKSGKYTVERPLHLGAALAGRLDELAGPLSAIGLPLGEAFQLRDDVLGSFGDADVIGKPVGDDLREGKPTPMLAYATERATPAQQGVLDLVGEPHLDDAAIVRIQEVLVDSGALAAAEARIAEQVDLALDAVMQAPIDAAAQRLLTDLAAYLAWRDR